MSTNYTEGTALVRTHDIPAREVVAQLYTRDSAARKCGTLPFVDNL